MINEETKESIPNEEVEEPLQEEDTKLEEVKEIVENLESSTVVEDTKSSILVEDSEPSTIVEDTKSSILVEDTKSSMLVEEKLKGSGDIKPKRELAEKLILGGGIELIHFKVVDLPSMVIIKKMVGSYVRKFTDKNDKFEKLVLTAENKGKKILAELTIDGKTTKAEEEANNVFVALDKVLKSF
ncbi:MAG: hypothetical protein KAQ83_03945 [Nanoarchaeota archaeon]|nr:hypothetical protein [Nanoarchaeota archaeon]